MFDQYPLSQITVKDIAEALPHKEDNPTMLKLRAAREALGTKAAVDSNSNFVMPPGVGSYNLKVWAASRLLARKEMEEDLEYQAIKALAAAKAKKAKRRA